MLLRCGRFEISLERPKIMGVVNATPDSFFEGARHVQADAAIARARELLADGADLLDIGAESTRPGADPVSEAEEWRRLAPVLEGLRGLPVPLSIDTRRPAVMRQALALGADMINDVSGFLDPDSIQAVAGSGAGVCIMHMAGDPSTMQRAPVYRDVVSQVREFLYGRVQALCAAGVGVNRIVLDPGIGFGKTLDHNIGLLRHLRSLASAGGVQTAGSARSVTLPILVGLSRKSMIGALTGREPAQRLVGSVVAAVAAVAQGASIVRVHDVAETRDGLAVWQAVGT